MMFNLAICAGPQAVRTVWMTKPRLGHPPDNQGGTLISRRKAAFYNDITLVDDELKMSGQNEQFYIRY